MTRVCLVVASVLTTAAVAQTQGAAQVKSDSVDVQGIQYQVKPIDASKVQLVHEGMPTLEMDAVTYEALRKANASAQAALSAEQAAKADQAKLRSGKLISVGVTAGVALGVLAPLSIGGRGPRSSQLLVADVTAVPYLTLVPAYWAYGRSSRNYCASSWGGSDEGEAYKTAVALADDEAERFLSVVDAFPRTENLADLQNQLKEFTGKLPRWILERGDLVAQIDDYLKTTDTEQRKAKRQALIRRVSAVTWEPTDATGYCVWSKFGLWVGVPATLGIRSYVGAQSPTDTNRDYKPTLAFGVTFVPNAYVSAMVGVTTGNMVVGETDTTKGTSYSTWAFITGFGGNLDLVSLLTNVVK